MYLLGFEEVGPDPAIIRIRKRMPSCWLYRWKETKDLKDGPVALILYGLTPEQTQRGALTGPFINSLSAKSPISPDLTGS